MFGKGGVPYVATHDGRTIRYPDPEVKVRRSAAGNGDGRDLSEEGGEVRGKRGEAGLGRCRVGTVHGGGEDWTHASWLLAEAHLHSTLAQCRSMTRTAQNK